MGGLVSPPALFVLRSIVTIISYCWTCRLGSVQIRIVIVVLRGMTRTARAFCHRRMVARPVSALGVALLEEPRPGRASLSAALRLLSRRSVGFAVHSAPPPQRTWSGGSLISDRPHPRAHGLDMVKSNKASGECAVGCVAADYQDDEQLQSVATTGPELTMRRRAPSSGPSARDQVACMTQASVKCRKHQHDSVRVSIRCEKSNARFV